jgi:GTP-binding protein Era
VDARADLEKFFGKQIHIELYVKVNKNWRSNVNMLKRFLPIANGLVDFISLI